MRAYDMLIVFGGLVCLSEVNSEPKMFPPFGNKRSPPPPKMSRRADPNAVETAYITQRLDHFNSSNEETYEMRFMFNEQFYKKGKPVFIFVGGEWQISADYLLGGFMFDLAKSMKAFMIYTEHRYYGMSHRRKNTFVENLKYLTVDQALYDVMHFIKTIMKVDIFHTKVIVFGCSYGGTIATWLRMKYPDVIHGAVACSAPVIAKSNFFEYLETLSGVILTYGGKKCLDTIINGFHITTETLKRDPDHITDIFQLCHRINTSDTLNVQTFFITMLDKLQGLVQYARPKDIEKTCLHLQKFNGNDMEKIADYVRDQKILCTTSQYAHILKNYSETSIDSPNKHMRLWLYQACTQFGYFQTTDSILNRKIFGDSIRISYFEDHVCKDLFGKRFNAENLHAGVDYINKEYRGFHPNVTKVCSTHGDIDPWHKLGILKDINEESPAFFIHGISHCMFCASSDIHDSEELKIARQKVKHLIEKWVS